ncbi:tetratricopeptide repeat protein [Dyella solisilvae]|uniref:Tetratricopeptide repeat protein n=1 Tax=Dyella solisilvae TaxID=1920168 RepID=A0A370KCC7_9GAMM|nr:tetratricopeptide repeat protein [Dyella solisilvae]RDJ00098.1 tetratricopeptide repeat protein [Dyella solisilvae]
MQRIAFGVLVVCLLAACATQPDQKAKSAATQVTLYVDKSGNPATSPEEEQVLSALHMIQDGKIMAAIDGPLNAVIGTFEAQYAHADVKVYSARGATDALIYATLGTGGASGQKVEVLGPAWAMAYWARGYAYGEMARYDDERLELEKALALAPMDAQYSNELGYVYLQKHEWQNALSYYEKAEGFADFNPSNADSMKCTSFRGQGYVLVELHRLDEAEAKYRACLKITPNEPKSLGEIGYIEGLRKTQH